MKKNLLVIVIISFAISCFAQTPTTNLQIVGLTESVTVRRDTRSIPYIEAKNDADLYFAQGFVTASDRLWQMDLFRRVARGETAEIFGKMTLEEDKRWRRFGFSEIAEKSLPMLSRELKNALDNYARGVNAYIATLDAKSLPVEFQILQYKPREWKPTDTLVIGKILSDALSSTWDQDLLRSKMASLPSDKLQDLINNVTPNDVILFGKDSKVKNAKMAAQSLDNKWNFTSEIAQNEFQTRKNSLERVGFYAENLAASNNWVISGKRTKDGKALLANDPHLQPNAPGIWYLSHLSAPNMRVSGVTFPGVPGVVLGHNENIAWGATNVGPDVQDLYVESIDETGKYKTPNGSENAVTRKEEIKVRINPFKPDTENVSLEVIETRNGVVIAEDQGKKIALKWTARDPKNQEFEAFFRLNRAANWEDFKGSLKTYGGASQNFVYADAKGNIGWYAAGRIPIRKSGSGALPYDGATNDGEWLGMIPFEELPNLYNPPEGFIVTANQRIVGTDYKYFETMSRDAALPWRARRIYELLKSNTKVTMDDVRDIQYDSFNIPISNFAKEIVKLEAASSETLDTLKNWNGKMTTDSKGAILANEIRSCVAKKIAADNKGVGEWQIREKLLWWIISEKSARWLPKDFADYKSLLTACDTDAQKTLSDPKRLGADKEKWVWGGLFKSRFPHPLAVAPLIGGQFNTPNDGIDGSGQTPNVGSAVSMRHIASPGNWDETRHIIPLGQSGNPKSPHYKDQFEAWKTGTPAIFPFTKSAVEKSAISIVIMNGN